jgi:hypothetical protein
MDAAYGQLQSASSTNNFRLMLAVARRTAPETAEVLAQHLAAGPPAPA